MQSAYLSNDCSSGFAVWKTNSFILVPRRLSKTTSFPLHIYTRYPLLSVNSLCIHGVIGQRWRHPVREPPRGCSKNSRFLHTVVGLAWNTTNHRVLRASINFSSRLPRTLASSSTRIYTQIQPQTWALLSGFGSRVLVRVCFNPSVGWCLNTNTRSLLCGMYGTVCANYQPLQDNHDLRSA